MESQRVTLSMQPASYRLIQSATADISNIAFGDGSALDAQALIDPVITVAPGFEESFAVEYGEGVIVPEPEVQLAALAALATLAALRRRREADSGSARAVA